MTYKELKEKQVGGSHYKLPIQPWDFYKADFTREEWVGYLKGNIIDYLMRKKNGLEDLRKAQHLLDVLVATEEEAEGKEAKMLYADRRDGPIERRKCWQYPTPDEEYRRVSEKRGRRADDISYQEANTIPRC